MVVGFVSCVLSGALRAALLVSGPLVCKAGQQLALAGCPVRAAKRAARFEPPSVGRFALSSVILTRRKLRDKATYRAANGCAKKEKSRILDEFIAVTSHVLRDQFFHEVIEIINEAAAQHRLKGHAGLE